MLIIIVIAILSRVAIWIYAIYFPISNERGIDVSPIRAYSAIDLNFYIYNLATYTNLMSLLLEGKFDLLASFYNSYFGSCELRGLPENCIPNILSTPVIPLLMYIFNFSETNAWPLSLFFLLSSSIWAVCWLHWMDSKNISLFFLAGFSLLPLPFWYMLNISSDMIFALFVGLVFLIFFNDSFQNKWKYLILIALAILAVGTRVNGVSICIFLFVVFIFSNNILIIYKIIFSLIMLLFIYYFWDFFYSYLSNYSTSSAQNNMIFGYYVEEYYNGIFDFLPKILNIIISLITLLLAKIIYLSGLRPSFSSLNDANLFLVILRNSCGIIILPGIIRSLIKSSKLEIFFIVCFIIPILFGTAQERYILPLIPIFYFHGAIFYSNIIKLSYNKIIKYKN